MHRVRAKICGITNEADARLVVEAGANALGFMFAESPRRVSPARARRIIAGLPPGVDAVGVFVNARPEVVAETAVFCGLRWIQLHGEESPEVCRRWPGRVIKAFRMRDSQSLAAMASYEGTVAAFLLDTFRKGVPGGTGSVFDWRLAVRARKMGMPLILSGGLTPENVRRAIRQVHPFAVDVGSGVEAQPGRKDPVRVAGFMAAVRGEE